MRLGLRLLYLSPFPFRTSLASGDLDNEAEGDRALRGSDGDLDLEIDLLGDLDTAWTGDDARAGGVCDRLRERPREGDREEVIFSEICCQGSE